MTTRKGEKTGQRGEEISKGQNTGQEKAEKTIRNNREQQDIGKRAEIVQR